MDDSPYAHLEEVSVGIDSVFRGNFIEVCREAVRLPDGSLGQREYVIHPGAVVIVPLMADGMLVMERQFRCPMKQVFWELPAGKLDAGESPLLAAQRELLEETGYSASVWNFCGSLHPCIGYSTEVIHVFYAYDLKQSQPKLDDGEFLDVECVPWETVWSAVTAAHITDAKTIVAMTWAFPFVSKVFPSIVRYA